MVQGFKCHFGIATDSVREGEKKGNDQDEEISNTVISASPGLSRHGVADMDVSRCRHPLTLWCTLGRVDSRSSTLTLEPSNYYDDRDQLSLSHENCSFVLHDLFSLCRSQVKSSLLLIIVGL